MNNNTCIYNCICSIMVCVIAFMGLSPGQVNLKRLYVYFIC